MTPNAMRLIALVASVAYGLMFVLFDVNTVAIIVGAVVVAALWLAAAAVGRGEVGPRDRAVRAERRSGRPGSR